MITSSDPINSEKYAVFSDFLKELGGRVNIKDSNENYKNINSISSNRLTIYRAYLEKVSLKGHTELGMDINGNQIPHAHNSFIHVMYKYGLIPGICFIIFCCISCIYAIKYSYYNNEKNNDYNLFPSIVIISFLIVSLFDYISTPFIPIGFCFWIVQIPLFSLRVN
jgi:hypothetical protein